MDKVKIFCDHSMTLREMTDNLLASGHFWTPPASFRVKATIMGVTSLTVLVVLTTSAYWYGS